MPETRYTIVYDNQGNIIAQEPYEVSDEELALEAIVASAEESKQKTKLHIFGTITPVEAESWVDNNVNDLASAKQALKYLAHFCILLRNRMLGQDY